MMFLKCLCAERVHFIDFEFMAYNYQAFDIANHFCEYVGKSFRTYIAVVAAVDLLTGYCM
jgi:thiamine kinase-like enzyme